ncbi:MAG: cytochrome c maturation protein CcmE [Rhodocyclaceae bacterium]
MTPRRKRCLLIGMALLLLVAATALVLRALRDNLVFFHTPSEVAAGRVAPGQTFRMGGMVQADSLVRGSGHVRFILTDTAQAITVTYQGALPDLFREGQGAVAQGSLNAEGVFVATELLAKHDENYMPPDALDAIDKAHRTAASLAAD